MKMYTLPTLIGILLISIGSLFGQNVSVLPAIKDNSMFNESGGKSLGDGKIFAGTTCNGNIRRALIQFDVSAIPSDATVTNVELKLGAEKSRNGGDGVIDIYAVDQSWGEGPSSASGGGGDGATAIAPDATWTDAMLGTAFWTTPGGDFNSSLLLSTRVTTEEFQTISFPTSGNFENQVEAWASDPSSNHGILIIGVEDANCSAYRFGSREQGTAPELVVTWENQGCQPPTTNLSIQACDSYISPTGSLYNLSGMYTELIPGPNNCDSVINIDLTIFQSVVINIFDTLCVGSTFTLGGVVYDVNNSTGSLLFQTVQGCDSIYNIDLTFVPETNDTIRQQVCEGFSIIVNGTTYDQSNPFGIEEMVNAIGCDSTIMIDLTFFPSSTSGLASYSGCEGDGFSVVINGTVYDENNPEGIEVLPAIDINGCDSTVIIDLNFAIPPNSGIATGSISTCNENGNIIDLNNLLNGADAGGVWTETSTNPSTGFSGNLFDGTGQNAGAYEFRYTVSGTDCPDAFTEVTVIVDAPLTATVIDMFTVCNNDIAGNNSIVNFNNLITAGNTAGTWFDADGVGVDLSDLANVTFDGVVPSVYSFPYVTPSNGNCPGVSYTCLITVESCICPPIILNENYNGCQGDDYEVIVNNVVYNQGNPTGTETMISATGCDSIVNVTLIFNAPSTSEEDFLTCDASTPPTRTEVLENEAFNGCDSIITFTTIYLPIDETFIFASTCDPAEVGVEMFTLTNTSGCDSIITISTELLPSDETDIAMSSCDPAEVGVEMILLMNQFGCDSIVTITTTLLPSDTTYEFGSSCFPQDTGIFITNLINQFGCDSLLITDVELLEVDNSVTVVDATITATSAGATYQWIDCDNNNAPIMGETGQSFTATVTGNYAVEITQNGCTETSECSMITVVNTEDVWFADQLSLSPNPTSGDIRLTFGELEIINMRLLDLTGKVMFEKSNLTGGTEDLRIEGPAGLYFLGIEVGGEWGWIKVVKVN